MRTENEKSLSTEAVRIELVRTFQIHGSINMGREI